MNQPDLNPALQVAVAIVTAIDDQAPDVTTTTLVGDIDPIDVVTVLSIALHAALGVTLGSDGRRKVMTALGLEAARRASR